MTRKIRIADLPDFDMAEYYSALKGRKKHPDEDAFQEMRHQFDALSLLAGCGKTQFRFFIF